MALVNNTPDLGTPDWWLKKLCKDLDDRIRSIDVFESYYNGTQPIVFATDKFRESFGGMFTEFSDNWCALVVDAVEERLNVEGFRYGQNPTADKDAWRIWQENNLDAASQLAHIESIKCGESYAIVWYDEKDINKPQISIEHPRECIVAFKKGSRRQRAAALKRWVDDDGYTYAFLYLPDGVYKYRSNKASAKLTTFSQTRFEAWELPDEVWPLPNATPGVVPVVPLRNRPTLLGQGVSELADLIPIQDALNKTLMDMLVASEFVAAPQRWATGVTVRKDDNGNALPGQFDRLINRYQVSENESAKFGQFAEPTLTSYRAIAEMFVQHFASRSRTPPHYFYLSGQFPSGESIKSAETGLVAKTKRKHLPLGEGWEEVIRLSFAVKGVKSKAEENAAETVWSDPESRSESEHMDAIGKKVALLKVPIEQAWQDAGYSPQQIERMKVQLKEQQEWLPSVAQSPLARETQIASGASPDDGTALPPQVPPPQG